MFALILTKALAHRVFFSIFACFLIKALQNGLFFLLFLPLFSPKPFQKWYFFLHFCSNPNQILSQRVFFSIFALILTIALPKMVFTLFLPLF